MTTYKYGKWRDNATKIDWKKYYRSLHRARSGVTGDSFSKYDYSLFNKYELTTRLGDDNSFKTFVMDHKHLMWKLKRAGYDLEYCACPEYSPKNNLLHIHGIFRGKNDARVGDRFPSQPELSEFWARLHNAPIVYIAFPRSEKDCIDYMTKHVVKEYPDISSYGLRMMISKGWMPKNWQMVNELLTKAAIQAIGKGVEEKNTWVLTSELYFGWCAGTATFPFMIGDRRIVIVNQKIYENGVYVDLLVGGCEILGIDIK